MLGELFEGQALRDLLIDAIRYGEQPEKRAELFRKVEGVVEVEAIERLVAQRKLTSEGMDPAVVSAIREEMERAQARRLQPHFISAFFREAFALLGGRIVERERGRFEITRVPSILKERDRLIGRADPVLDRYARVTFDKALIVGQPQAEPLASGHPLLDAAVDVVLERFQPLLGQGAVLVDAPIRAWRLDCCSTSNTLSAMAARRDPASRASSHSGCSSSCWPKRAARQTPEPRRILITGQSTPTSAPAPRTH